MKKIIFLMMLASDLANAGDVWVQPHLRANGTFVEGYHRSSPDSSLLNNYSTQGNVNPFTGREGSVNPYQQPQYQQPPQYLQPQYQQPYYNQPMPQVQPMQRYCNPYFPATCR